MATRKLHRDTFEIAELHLHFPSLPLKGNLLLKNFSDMRRSHPFVGWVQKFAKLLANAAETLGTTISEARIRNYAVLLDDCQGEAIRVAIPQLLRCGGSTPGSDRFLPSVPEIRAACGLLTTTDRAVLAWAAVSRAAAEAGAYLSVAFEDGAIAAAIETVWGS